MYRSLRYTYIHMFIHACLYMQRIDLSVTCETYDHVVFGLQLDIGTVV